MSREPYSLLEFLTVHAGSDPVSFHMPGHKGSRFFREQGYGQVLEKLVDMDVTEISGADNLFQPETVIADLMERYRRLYGTKASYILVNGSSAGLIASVMACVPRGGKIIMARNCHKSLFNAVNLTEALAVYAYPEISEDYGITGEIRPDEIIRCIDMAPDAGAVVLPSPNYYGICSDIGAIAEICQSRGIKLIVDQAHGAHLKFYGDENSLDAGSRGADIVVESTHKTLASFTQSAVLNIYSEDVDVARVEDALQKLESTSPSYILMASMDMNADLLENKGEELMKTWRCNLDRFYQQASGIPGVRLMKHPMLDRTKINIDMSQVGLDGLALEEELEKRGIFPELATGNILMCMTGIGNSREDYSRLLDALTEISVEYSGEGEKTTRKPDPGMQIPYWNRDAEPAVIPDFGGREIIPIEEARGKKAASPIIPYPPGIPLVCPGEVIEQEVIDYVTSLRGRGEKVMGVDARGMVEVLGIQRT